MKWNIVYLPEAREDASRVRFADGEGEYTWRTTALTLVLDKRRGTFACSLPTGERVWTEAKPVAIVPAAASNEVDSTSQCFATTGGESYFGGGQKGKDAPQICEVNIPEDARSLTFEFVQEGDVWAGGLWKNIKLVK